MTVFISLHMIVRGAQQIAKVCVSKQLCENKWQIAAVTGPFESNLKCCEDNLCNGVRHTGAGILLLMESLSLAMFS